MIEMLFRMVRLCTKWKPDWLYESMPYVYAVTGLAAIFHFDMPIGYGSGALLLVAAVIILLMRVEYRVFKHINTTTAVCKKTVV